MATESYELTDRYLADEGQVFLTGIQALARLPLDQLRADRRAGLNTAAFISGYQGSPLGWLRRRGRGGRSPRTRSARRRAARDQRGARASSVMGSQLADDQPDCRYDGRARHLVRQGARRRSGGGRAPPCGLHREPRCTAAPSRSSATTRPRRARRSRRPRRVCCSTCTCRCSIRAMPGEALLLGRHAATLSRATGLWAAVKIVADVADATASVELRPRRLRPGDPARSTARTYVHRPDGRLLTPHTLELEQEIVEVRYELARATPRTIGSTRSRSTSEHAWIGIVSSGITYREVREAFGRLGLRTDDEIRPPASGCSRWACRCRSIPRRSETSRPGSTRSS